MVIIRNAPLSSISTTITSMSVLARNLFSDFSNSLGMDHMRLINRKEELVLFESNRNLFLPNGSLFNATSQTTSSILSNINLLRSNGISPEDYSIRLECLYESRPKDAYYKKYSAFASIYTLFHQYLLDKGFLTESDLFARLSTDEIVLDTLASRSPHLFLMNLELFTPVQCRFLSSLLHRQAIQSALLTAHDSLTRSDLVDVASCYFSDIPSIAVDAAASVKCVTSMIILYLVERNESSSFISRWLASSSFYPVPGSAIWGGGYNHTKWRRGSQEFCCMETRQREKDN